MFINSHPQIKSKYMFMEDPQIKSHSYGGSTKQISQRNTLHTNIGWILAMQDTDLNHLIFSRKSLKFIVDLHEIWSSPTWVPFKDSISTIFHEVARCPQRHSHDLVGLPNASGENVGRSPAVRGSACWLCRGFLRDLWDLLGNFMGWN